MEFRKYAPFVPAVAGVVICLALFGLFKILSGVGSFGAQTPTQTTRYSLFASSTLSNAYTGNATTGRLSKSLSNVVLSGFYQAKTDGAKVFIIVERSIDDGATYQPYSTITPESADVLINTSGSGTSSGTPLIVPGNGASVSGTSYGFSSDFTLAADFLRFSAKEVSSSTGSVLVTPGVLTLKTMLQSQ